MAPDIGDIFKIVNQDYPESSVYFDKHDYRVTGWMKKAPPPKPMPDLDGDDINAHMRAILDHVLDAGNREFNVGEEKTRLMWCIREEAEYICGAGIAGTLQPLNRVEVTGRVNWKEEHIEDARRSMARRVGEILF